MSERQRRKPSSVTGVSSRSIKKPRRDKRRGQGNRLTTTIRSATKSEHYPTSPLRRGRPTNRHHHSTTVETEGDINREIVEQLRRQREQQHQQSAQARNEESLSKAKQLDGQVSTIAEKDISSPARKRQFPFRQIGPPSPFSSRLSTLNRTRDTLGAPSVLEACNCPWERRRLVSLFATQRLLHSGDIISSATELPSGYWSHLFHPLPSRQQHSNEDADLYGLLHNPAWTRTFDVWQYRKDEPPQIISTGIRDITTRDIHRSMLVPVSNLNAITCRYRALPTDMNNRARMHFEAVARSSETRDTVRSFRVDYSSPPNPSLAALVGATHPMINDLCYLSETTVLLAPLYNRVHHRPNLPVIVLNNDNARRSRPGHTKLVPHSDALCIEADYPGGLACTGFRNGQLLVTDLQGTTQAATAPIATDAEVFGSIHSLLGLGDKQMLARGSMGTCRLFDLRKLSSVTDRSQKNIACVVNEYQIPTDLVTGRLTRKCRGIATDPSRSTVFSPIVSRDEVPALAAWSLHTGEYISAKPLAPHPDTDAGDVIPSTSSWGVSWVELCSRVTSAWEPANDALDKAGRRTGSFALWYKTGMSFAGPNMPSSAGKIHQVVFDGQPYC